jgi:hypothetical protein
MLMRHALLLLLCLAGPAWSQSYPPPGVSSTQLKSAVQAAIPAPASTMPPATALDGSTGGAIAYARADHTHAARVQRTVMTTAADGTATWTFARPIVCASGKLPPISNMVEDTGSPVVVQITGRAFASDATAGTDTHTAVTIRAQRSQFLPATLVSLASLVSFNVFGASASGVKVNLWAADPTQ